MNVCHYYCEINEHIHVKLAVLLQLEPYLFYCSRSALNDVPYIPKTHIASLNDQIEEAKNTEIKCKCQGYSIKIIILPK